MKFFVVLVLVGFCYADEHMTDCRPGGSSNLLDDLMRIPDSAFSDPAGQRTGAALTGVRRGGTWTGIRVAGVIPKLVVDLVQDGNGNNIKAPLVKKIKLVADTSVVIKYQTSDNTEWTALTSGTWTNRGVFITRGLPIAMSKIMLELHRPNNLDATTYTASDLQIIGCDREVIQTPVDQATDEDEAATEEEWEW